MKHKIKCLLFTLLLCSCEEVQHMPESFSTIGEILVKNELAVTTTARSSASKDAFALGDKIYLYGYSKLLPADTIGARFMPAAAGTIGTVYEYEKDQDGWHRFQRPQIPGDQEMGFWRTKQYHDFTAYYLENEPLSPDFKCEMGPTGLPKEDLLWGNITNVYFSGETHIVPKIMFKHQLSRIKVEVMHDMENITAEDFEIREFKFKLDKSEETFNLETGKWKNPKVEEHLIIETFTPLVMDTFPKLTFVEIADLWVLPDCTISDFEFSITQKGEDKDFYIDFESLFNGNDNGDPATIITKPGYITVLQIKFGDIKQIIFTVSLKPWEVEKKTGAIEDRDIDIPL